MGLEPWVTDGTREGTRVIDVHPTSGSSPRQFAPIGKDGAVLMRGAGVNGLVWLSPSGDFKKVSGQV